jgi:hypothetical protein
MVGPSDAAVSPGRAADQGCPVTTRWIGDVLWRELEKEALLFEVRPVSFWTY